MAEAKLSLGASGFESYQLEAISGAGIDLQKLWELIVAIGPTVIPAIQAAMRLLPQTTWVKIIQVMLEALYKPVPAA